VFVCWQEWEDGLRAVVGLKDAASLRSAVDLSTRLIGEKKSDFDRSKLFRIRAEANSLLSENKQTDPVGALAQEAIKDWEHVVSLEKYALEHAPGQTRAGEYIHALYEISKIAERNGQYVPPHTHE